MKENRKGNKDKCMDDLLRLGFKKDQIEEAMNECNSHVKETILDYLCYYLKMDDIPKSLKQGI